MARHKVQAYDISDNTKQAINKLCDKEQRSESFIVSRILNKMFDPIIHIDKKQQIPPVDFKD